MFGECHPIGVDEQYCYGRFAYSARNRLDTGPFDGDLDCRVCVVWRSFSYQYTTERDGFRSRRS
jgi:hypothetical protein